jgi:hypothetical protein
MNYFLNVLIIFSRVAQLQQAQNIECQIKTAKKSNRVNVTTGAKIKPARMTSAKNSKKPITVFVATARERTGA